MATLVLLAEQAVQKLSYLSLAILGPGHGVASESAQGVKGE
jgi:hypothetical protein